MEINTQESLEKNTYFIHGLNLEGAHWQNQDKLLVETISSNRFEAFPYIKVKTNRNST